MKKKGKYFKVWNKNEKEEILSIARIGEDLKYIKMELEDIKNIMVLTDEDREEVDKMFSNLLNFLKEIFKEMGAYDDQIKYMDKIVAKYKELNEDV